MAEINYSNIGDVDKFNAEDYPNMAAELTTMISDLHHIPVYYKKDIVVAYLKDHSVKTEWINANPNLVKLMTSGTLTTGHLEKLFEGCRWNAGFRTQYERYIKQRLS
jgi:hypothetical protein